MHRITLEQVRAAMPPVAASFRQLNARLMGDRETIAVRPLRERLYGDMRASREVVERSLGSQTFNAILLGGLAGLALLLAAVGLYGVISHLVGQQRREIGIRMALGATQTGVLTRFVRHALLVVAAGIVIGLAGAFGLTRFMRTLLSDISATDPWVFVLAPALLLAIALVAALRPALRAARIDPARALRAD